MKQCPKCYAENPLDAKFCRKCGSDFNGGSFVTDDLPAHIVKQKSDIIPEELKSLYGSVVSD